MPGALHKQIEVAVCVVVDDTARRAHQHRAHDEDPQHHPLRHAPRGKPQAPQRGPQQQQNADGLVQPHQLLVEVEAFAQGQLSWLRSFPRRRESNFFLPFVRCRFIATQHAVGRAELREARQA